VFLITTSDQRFWKQDEPVIFLGEWCKLYAQKDVWENMPSEVLPYHWDDRKKLYQDYLHLNGLYEQMLLELSTGLNKIHGLEHSTRYWRIIIGPWLFFFIQVYYDRYQSVLSAAASEKVTHTFIGRYERQQWVPRDYRIFDGWAISEGYNHYLYSRLIESTNRIPFETLEVESSSGCEASEENKVKWRLSSAKTAFMHFLRCSCRSLPAILNQTVFVSPPFKMADIVKLQLSMGQLPYVSPPYVTPPDSSVDWSLRSELIECFSTNEFENLLCNMIKEQIPTVYIEGFVQMKEAALDTYPKKPKAIVCGSDFNSNDGFKIWAAHQVDQGVKFSGVQYGGHYGTGLWSSTQEHEINIYDRYYTWGWDLKEKENVTPLPLVKFNLGKQKIQIQPQKHAPLLLVAMALPRYSYYMYSLPVGTNGMHSYFDDQYRFVRALSKENQKELLVRLYLHHDYGLSQKERWADELPEIVCYDGNKTMTEQIAESRLFIGTYNATTYLETFVINYPTLLFWNPNHWELNAIAQPYFDDLRRVGILHDDPESAAEKVNKIGDDPLAWWSQPHIQEAKDKFCHRFAHTSSNWLQQWKSEIKKLKA
jgi:putative transferase (TIGR04331 family)